MSRLKVLAVFALVLFMTIPVGLVQAQEEAFSGWAVIWDDQALSDAITYSMTGVPSAGGGMVYEGWVFSDDGSVKTSTGVMAVAGGTISHSWTSPDGENLIHNYDKVVVTVEPVPDDDPGPSGVIAFSHAVPAGAMAHIRHLLTNWPPGEDKGILTNLQEQLDIAVLHANLAKDSDTLEDVQLHVHHVINIIEGEDGPNFDESFGNPGDGVGALTHAQDRRHGPFAAGEAPNDAVITSGAESVDAAGKNAEDWATQARDRSLTVLERSTISSAKVLLSGVIGSLDAAANGNQTTGTGGAKQAYWEAQRMATYTLMPGPPGAAPPGAGPSLPVSGDASIPLMAQLALIASLVALSMGGLLVIGSRRSRTNA